MSPLLDEELNNKVLAYVTEPRACVTCSSWKTNLYEALQLDCRIRFHQRMVERGSVIYSYNAVRPLGEDFEESVGYHFDFASDGTYQMQWTRTFDAWSSQSEQHFGSWRISMGRVFCETLEPENANDEQVRYAEPGFKFSVSLQDILDADGKYFTAKAGSPPHSWELPARTGKVDEKERTESDMNGMWATEVTTPTAQEEFRAPVNPDARYVDIDGDMHEVSGDIVANWPEEDWPRLMKCRLRFGVNGTVGR